MTEVQTHASIGTVTEQVLANQGIGGGYGRYVNPVVDALTERERAIADAIVAFAMEQGLDEAAARAMLVQVGMSVRPVAVADEPRAVTPGTESQVLQDIVTSLGRINNTINMLEGFARQHGYRG